MLLKLYFVLNIFYMLMKTSYAVQINYVKVPGAVKNNSGEAAILDCNYSVRPDDTELVIKWFLNDEVVYQWIPSQKPQSLGQLKDRVDLSFRATDDPKTVYRAMKIINPTSDIAGEYKCFVSTFADEDFSAKSMIVFEPESSLILLKDQPDEVSINFTCFASYTYPAPKLIMYKDKKDNLLNKKPLQIVQWNTSKHPNGRYSGFIIVNSKLTDLSPGFVIHCELRIPGTGYVKKKSILYYPTLKDKNHGIINISNHHYYIIILFIHMSLC